jgi:hypothetical protein
MTPERRLAFRLALELGYANPEYMLSVIPYRIWRDWIDYYGIEPFGEERADMRAGIVAATIANCLARKKGKPAFRPDQFMPKFEKPVKKEPKTADQLFEKVKALNKMFGGTFIDKQDKDGG